MKNSKKKSLILIASILFISLSSFYLILKSDENALLSTSLRVAYYGPDFEEDIILTRSFTTYWEKISSDTYISTKTHTAKAIFNITSIGYNLTIQVDRQDHVVYTGMNATHKSTGVTETHTLVEGVDFLFNNSKEYNIVFLLSYSYTYWYCSNLISGGYYCTGESLTTASGTGSTEAYYFGPDPSSSQIDLVVIGVVVAVVIALSIGAIGVVYVKKKKSRGIMSKTSSKSFSGGNSAGFTPSQGVSPSIYKEMNSSQTEQSVNMMLCRNCLTQNLLNKNFCKNCGAPLN